MNNFIYGVGARKMPILPHACTCTVFAQEIPGGIHKKMMRVNDHFHSKNSGSGDF